MASSYSERVKSAAIPTGLVTLLFSDIEGSTTRWERYPKTMPFALRRHDALLHQIISEHNGHVFKTVGDEFCCVFSDVANAAEAAVAVQRALAAEDWSEIGGLRVRIAIHTGVTDERQGDYFGSPVNRVARLLSAAHGGQILVSAAAAENLHAVAEPAFSLRDLGKHRLKDFPELQTIHQIIADALPDIFPPLRTISDRPTNLPHQLSALVGRDDVLAELIELLKDKRVVSVVGAGGVGKTAIALHLGSTMLQDYEEGVWYAELAPLTDSALVITTVGRALGVTATEETAILDALIAYLRNKTTLLIIDNCEHVLSASAHLVEAITRSCPKVRIVVTSREPLGMSGEVVYRLPSLSIPPESTHAVDDIAQYGAVQLFLERARAHVPGFTLSVDNATNVAKICRRLDGIALALELAASRLRVLSVAHLEERLAERFRLLTGGSRTALPRHQTMRALIDWSHDLLTDSEKKLFRRISCFAGGWSLSAAMAVCADEQVEAWDIVDLSTSLVDKSLVNCDGAEPEPRYGMLETTRQYAAERLAATEEKDAIAEKHAQYFLALAQRADDAWSRVPAKEWIAPLNVELDNFRGALRWEVSERRDASAAFALFTSLEAFWWDAQPVEGRRWVDELKPMLDLVSDRAATAKFYYTAANIALTLRHQKAALDYADQSLRHYQELDDDLGRARAQRCRGAALINLGRIDEGDACLNDALTTFRQQGNRRLIALALRTLARVPHERGDLPAAASLYREALGYAEALADQRGSQIILGNLAEVEADDGRYVEALTHARDALEIARVRRDGVTACSLLVNIAAYLIVLGRFEEARGAAQEALSIADEIDSPLHYATAIQHIGAVCSVRGDPVRAAHLLGYSDEHYRLLETPRETTEAKEYERSMVCLRQRLSPSELARALEDGSHCDAQQIRAEALLV